MAKRLGVDLGGTKIEVAVLDAAHNILWREREPTPQGDYAGTVETMAALIERAEAECGAVASIGVGTPGTISPRTGLIKNANSVVLNDRPLKRDLETRLGREVLMANDANCLALSESAADGAAAEAGTVFGVILGTGVGGGLVVEGRVLLGRNAIAGEWGHNPLPWTTAGEQPGPSCWCGHEGCIEQWLSGPAFERDYAEQSGERLDGAEIVARAESGDSVASEALERYVDRLARALAHVINLFDPDVIVLGGGMSNCEVLYDRVPARWDEFVFSDPITTRLVPPSFGDSSGVRGAAFLADSLGMHMR
ncbi:ROK family protein [Guyparkeria hydrothermalis]|uniref:ROK family protein n=1 Tax=Guyparkeria hydrothermalis TaxID=923 RepID=UPI00202208F6|nr:ROK family protein [Guyparkeria hydrothermalis]MCL7744082.1 ROK family protein [Guyparkeria hydrothermalis]